MKKEITITITDGEVYLFALILEKARRGIAVTPGIKEKEADELYAFIRQLDSITAKIDK